MFISKKDLEELENKMKEYFHGIIQELNNEIDLLKPKKPRQKTNKDVD